MNWTPVKYEQELAFPLPRRRVWELLSDTDHLNRYIGLFRIEASVPAAVGQADARTLRARSGPMAIAWREHPFEWRRDEYYAVVREYTSGPLKLFYGGAELFDGERLEDGSFGTRVRLFAEFTPANAIGRLAIPIKGAGSMRRTFQFVRHYLRMRENGQERLIPQARSTFDVDVRLLDRLLEQLAAAPIDRSLAAKLRQHLLTQDDNDVIDMRPYEWCERWATDREQSLRLFLYATRCGITNLSWNLLCPNCRVSKSQAGSLAQLDPVYHCDYCGIDYTANLDRHVELVFSVHPLIRKAYKHVFCVGGPAISPHVWAQTAVAAGGEAALNVPDTADRLRLRVLRRNRLADIAVGGEADRQPLVYTDAGWSAPVVRVAAPGERIRVENRSGGDIVLAMERADWDDRFVTAASVTTMHEFRGMFSSEVLAPGQQVGVENVALLFSDLLGSTAFYEQVGDAHAYGQVRKHFDYLRRWIHDNRGTIVKTIGDAVMAVFDSPDKAVRAAFDIQTHVRAFNETLRPEDRITLKIGVHHGPAIAVNSNGLLDYFGRTVNIAARVQALSRGNDIVVSELTAGRVPIATVPSGRDATSEPFAAPLKGIGEMRLIRYTMPA